MSGRPRGATGRNGCRNGGSIRLPLAFLALSLLAAAGGGLLVLRGGLLEPGGRGEEPAFPDRPELTLGRSVNHDYDPPEPGSYRLPAIRAAADGRVLDAEGRPRRLREILEGRITVLSFIYTRCADSSACPYATSVLNDIKSISERDALIAENLRLVSFSFDPEHDTPRVIAEYSQALRQSAGSEWLFLTTAGREDLEPILEDYGQTVDRKADPKDRLGPFNHLLRVYLIDRQGMVRNIYSSGLLDPRLVLTDVRTLLLEERTPDRDRRALDRLRSPPLGLPAVPEPEDNPATIEKIALGRKLFFDRRLSSNGTMSCAMCHIPEQGFTSNELSTPVGVNGRSLRRNAPAILNAAYAIDLFRDGRSKSLEAQAVTPLLAPDEMANPSAGFLIAKVADLDDYAGMFERAFGGGPSLERIGKAIAAWERTLLAGDAPFDRWRYGGDPGALTAEEKRGFDLFTGEARCATCHFVGAEHALFTDHSFHDTGIGYLHDGVASREGSPVLVEIAPAVFVPVEREVLRTVGESRPADPGRFEATGNPADRWRFKTPSLRNVALTAPYMHDGSLPTLEAVVQFYNRGGVPHPGLSPMIRPLDLDDSAVASIVAFLRSLTGGNLAELIADARSVEVGN